MLPSPNSGFHISQRFLPVNFNHLNPAGLLQERLVGQTPRGSGGGGPSWDSPAAAPCPAALRDGGAATEVFSRVAPGQVAWGLNLSFRC